MTTPHADSPLARPSLSFVIAAKDAAATIEATLRSLICQSRGDWEAIVIDDGSTDRTAEAASRVADPRVRVEACAPRGVARARNAGFALARAPFVCFLDADDTLGPGFVACTLASIGSADAVASGLAYRGPGLEDAGWTHTPGPADHTLDALCEFNQFAIGGVVFRRDALLAQAIPGVVGEAPHVFSPRTHHEDWELLLRLAVGGVTWAPVIPEPLLNYRLQPGSRTTNLRPVWQDGLTLIRRFHPSPREADDACRRWTLRCLARAVLAHESTLSTEMLAHTGPLHASDADVLAGALRWGIRRLRVSRTPSAMADSIAWRQAVARRLGGGPIAESAALRGFDQARDWSRVARAALDRVLPGQTLVLYGMGRNGQELLRHLDRSSVPLACIDDAPGPQPLPRVERCNLGPQHVVLVTPDRRATILQALAATGQAEILLPESLAPSARHHAA